MPRTVTARSWTAKVRARNAAAVDQADAKPAETFNELRARAKAAGVSAAGTRADIEARLADLEEA